MRERKISLWLTRLDEEEQELFLEFLTSPLHSNRPKLAELIELLLNKVVRKDNSSWTSEDFWKEFYPERNYNGNLLSRLLSEATHEFKQFIALRQFQSDPGTTQVQRLRWLRHQGWEDVIPSALKEVEQKLDRDLPRDEHYYSCKFHLAAEKSEYDMGNLGKSPGPIFQSSLDQLNLLFLTHLFRFSFYAKNHDKLHATHHSHPSPFTPFFNSFLQSKGNTTLLILYRSFAQYQKKPDDQLEFKNFCNALFESSPNYLTEDEAKTRIPKNVMRDLFSFALNNAQGMLNANKKEWAELYKQLIEIGLEKGIILTNGKIETRTFINTAGFLSKFGYLEWANSFVLAYQHLVDENQRDMVVKFSIAVNQYYKEDFEQSSTLLLAIKQLMNSKTDVAFNINTRSLLCRVWFELDDFESFIFEIQSFKTFLSRNKYFSRKRMEAFYNFCKWGLKLERILSGKFSQRKTGLQALLEAITASNTANKPWLHKTISFHLNRY